MIQILLLIIQYILVGCFSVVAASLFVLAILNRRERRAKYVFFPISLVFIGISIFIWNIDLTGVEPIEKDEVESAFERNFGFLPPASIKEIKVKNFNLYDASACWMNFTYDSLVLNKIIDTDTTLKIAERYSKEFEHAMFELHKENPNSPDWLKAPERNTDKIYYKKNYLKHNYSDCYLWVDKTSKMVYLRVSYFD